ncbi:hypothetical protein NDU88_011027 [Pleurodeles waltl]|uniref:Uncharacterized protein n=1 Tax=Pleurodeles waltl TaxID=8319 RepID=A0AAV7S322_PLEWA|nr:hypothetical protein NDU88_011027 [Pleurodeles waltl]
MVTKPLPPSVSIAAESRPRVKQQRAYEPRISGIGWPILHLLGSATVVSLLNDRPEEATGAAREVFLVNALMTAAPIRQLTLFMSTLPGNITAEATEIIEVAEMTDD